MYKRVWRISIIVNGFSTIIFLETSEDNLQDYLKTEINYPYSYVGATSKEVRLAKELGLPIYIYK